jgi:Tfp pilus assembly protein PilO
MLIRQLQKGNWYLRQGAHRLGVVGMIGLGILAFCAMLQFATIQPMQRQQADLQVLATLKPPVAAEAKPEDALTHLRKQLASFYKFFPERGDMAGQVENLFDTAKKYNLVLENGSYEVTRGDAHKLARCEVQLPVKGSYVQTREFIANVLQSMPNVALSAVSIQRQKIGDSTIDAQIKLTLYYQET